MNSKMKIAAVLGLMIALCAGEAAAQGGRGMGMGGNRANVAAQGTQSTVTRPAGSQRRDGTFLKTGLTANGSTTRPANGKGLRDGSCLTTTAPATTAQ